MKMPMLAMVHDTIMIGILPFLFKKGMKIDIGANLFVLFGTVGVTWTIFYTGGFLSGTMVWYGVLPIASLLLANKKSSYFWTAVCYTCVVTFGILQIQGFKFENQIAEEFVHHFNISAISGVVPMLFLLALVFENTKQDAFNRLNQKNDDLTKEKKRSDDLLLNILPYEVAEELKAKGHASAKLIDQATVLFTDFKGFTEMSESLSPQDLVGEINFCFCAFDRIMERHSVEKIKTIGDAYMAVGGIQSSDTNKPKHVINAALEIREFVQERVKQKKAKGEPHFDIRIGIHTGPVVAGIVGIKKFQYDIWGDTVNTANRMESSSEVGKINISQSTYELVKDSFVCEYRGEIEAKGKGVMKMYFVTSKS